MPLPRIHPFYRIWFTYVDPISLVLTVNMLFRERAFFMDGFIPSRISVADPMHGFLFHGQAALYAFMAVMLGGTLRVTSEIDVWRMTVGGVLMVDAALIASQGFSIEQQGRMSLEALRWQDWAGFGYTAGCGLIRAFFLANVGVETVSSGTKRD